jgi:hypothetical protein
LTILNLSKFDQPEDKTTTKASAVATTMANKSISSCNYHGGNKPSSYALPPPLITHDSRCFTSVESNPTQQMSQ